MYKSQWIYSFSLALTLHQMSSDLYLKRSELHLPLQRSRSFLRPSEPKKPQNIDGQRASLLLQSKISSELHSTPRLLAAGCWYWFSGNLLERAIWRCEALTTRKRHPPFFLDIFCRKCLLLEEVLEIKRNLWNIPSSAPETPCIKIILSNSSVCFLLSKNK